MFGLRKGVSLVLFVESLNGKFAKDTDGFFARHFDRKISGAISRQLLKTPVTPNQVTIGVTLLGSGAGG